MMVGLFHLAQSFWMPRGTSTVSDDVDWLFYFILYLSVFFFLLITGVMVYFVLKYRHGRKAPGEVHSAKPTHSTTLELTWTIIPTILVLLIFYWGFQGYLGMSVVPSAEQSYEIQVRGKMWSWEFVYPNGVVSPELHIPEKTPIRLVLSSDDVIHSLYIPNFRIKKDAVPGRYNKFWVEATEPTPEGKPHLVYCTEYCGTQHSTMITHCYVHTEAGFRNWLREQSNLFKGRAPAEVGQLVFTRRGCIGCHSNDGTARTGPTFKNLYAYERQFADGSSRVADEEYIRESIRQPMAKIVRGYAGVMPAYPAEGPGSLSDREVDAVIWYLKSLSDRFTGELPGIEPEGGAATQPAATQPAATQPANTPTAP